MIAALFVERGGAYWNLPNVDPWDQARDARLYAGPWPVVAHPPCTRWCRLAGLVEARWGYKKGEDGGCFAAAIHAVRTYGGVLEHPAYSDAWPAFDLPRPPRHGGWVRDFSGGWSCHVEQWFYGHPAKKATWLYASGIRALPSLAWGFTPDQECTAYVTDGGGGIKNPAKRPRALISWCGNHVKSGEKRRRLNQKEASHTPPAFRDLLLSIARSAAK